MSRHRSPRGRHGKTTSVLDLGASIPAPRRSNRTSDGPAAKTGSDILGSAARSDGPAAKTGSDILGSAAKSDGLAAKQHGQIPAQRALWSEPRASDSAQSTSSSESAGVAAGASADDRRQAESASDSSSEVLIPQPRTSILGTGPALLRPHPADLETTTIIEPETSVFRAAQAEPDRRAPGRRRRATPARRRRARSKRPRGLTTIGMVAAAVVVLVVGATLLARGGLSIGVSDETSTSDPAAQAQRPPIEVVPTVPPPPAPAQDQGAREAEEQAKKRAEAAKKQELAAPGDGALSMADCTRRVSDGASLNKAIASAAPGQKICATGNMGGSRLTITRSGTPSAPIQVIGNGSTAVKGITVSASNVVVGGFTAVSPQAPGIQLTGNNITVRNNKVSRPTGGDHDGLRFFGNNLKILNNTISDVDPGGTGAHADCMQTFQSDTPSSKNVVIDGNRCERVDNMCLMAEGPGDEGDGGDGKGVSANWTFSNNYCDTHASQALMIEAVQNVTVRNNQIVGKVDKAFAFDIGSTGAKVLGNKLAPGISYEVGMDSSSRPGYQGPAVGGSP